MHKLRKHRKKWTFKEFFQLWGILAFVSVILCVVMLVFYFTGKGEGLAFRFGGNRSTTTQNDFPLYLYAAGFFGGTTVVNLILMALTKLHARLHKTKGTTVVLKKRYK